MYFIDYHLGGWDYLLVMLVGASLAGMATVALRRRTVYRLEGGGAWVAFALLAPLALAGGYPLARLVQALAYGWYVPVLIAFILQFVWIHWFVPSMVPDFQSNDLAGSGYLALAMTVPCALAAAYFLGGMRLPGMG